MKRKCSTPIKCLTDEDTKAAHSEHCKHWHNTHFWFWEYCGIGMFYKNKMRHITSAKHKRLTLLNLILITHLLQTNGQVRFSLLPVTPSQTINLKASNRHKL